MKNVLLRRLMESGWCCKEKVNLVKRGIFCYTMGK